MKASSSFFPDCLALQCTTPLCRTSLYRHKHQPPQYSNCTCRNTLQTVDVVLRFSDILLYRRFLNLGNSSPSLGRHPPPRAHKSTTAGGGEHVPSTVSRSSSHHLSGYRNIYGPTTNTLLAIHHRPIRSWRPLTGPMHSRKHSRHGVRVTRPAR